MIWQPIETAPKEGPVIVSDGSEIAIVTQADHKTRSWNETELRWEWHIYPQVWEGDGDMGGLATVPFTPTHWMHPPQLPLAPHVISAPSDNVKP